MIKGKQNILEHFKASGWAYWAIYGDSKARNNAIAKSSSQDNLSPDTSAENLKAVLDRLSPGSRYYVVIKESPDQAKSFIDVPYEHDGVLQEAPQQNQISGFHSIESIRSEASKIAAELFDQKMKDKELEDLRRENIELKKLKVSPFEEAISGFVNKYPEVIKTISENIFPSSKKMIAPAVSVSGLTKEQVQRKPVKQQVVSGGDGEENLNDEQKRLENSLMDLQKADPNFLAVLEKLSKVAKEEPEKYNTYKPFLLEE